MVVVVFTFRAQIHGGYERRKFERKLPRKSVPVIKYPRLRTAPSASWASGGGVSRSGLTSMGGEGYGQTSPMGPYDAGGGAWMAQVKTFGGAETLPEGFVAPDPHTYKDALRTATKGRTRRVVAERIRTDLTDVSRLEGFKPPNTKALRFY